MFRRFAALSLALSLAACAPENETRADSAPTDPESQDDVELAGDTAEALTILEFINDGGTTFEMLDESVGLDSRAAGNLIAHRDGADAISGTSDDDLFDSVDELDAISYVGPTAIASLTEYVVLQGWTTYASGSYEGVVFNAPQTALALDLVNFAALETLDVDAKLDSRAAENIVEARPITSLKELAEISWVGPATLERLRAYLPTWQLQGVTLEVYDGVSFTHEEAANALAAANLATKNELAAAGIGGAQDDILFAKRPFSSLSLVTSTAGIGPLTTMRLKLLGGSFHANVYVVSGSDAAWFAETAEGALRDDEGFGGEIAALLADVAGDEAYTDAVIASLMDAIADRVHAFATMEVGREYSSRDAAFDAVYQYGRGLFLTARTAYPEGVLEFLAPKTQTEKLARGKKGILAYFQNVLVPSDEWYYNLNGKTWEQVKSQVQADVAAFETTEAYEVYQEEHATIFVGRVYGLYTETTVDDVGKVVRVFIEID